MQLKAKWNRTVYPVLNNVGYKLLRCYTICMMFAFRHNATITLPDNVIVTKEYTILIPNPCLDTTAEAFSSRLIIHPICAIGVDCWIINRRLCCKYLDNVI